MRGRALGRGRIQKKKRKHGPDVYVGDWQDADGKRMRKVLASDKRTAERMLAEIIRERDLYLAGMGSEPSQETLIDDIMGDYLADLGTRTSADHTDQSQRCLVRILGRLKVRRVRDIAAAEVLEFRRVRLAKGAANATANRDVCVLKAMLNWAVRTGLIGFSPLQGIQKLPEGKGHQKAPRRDLTEEEISSFLKAAYQQDVDLKARKAAETTIRGGTKGKAYRNRKRSPRIPQGPLWFALLETAARWGELTSAKWGDFDRAKGQLTLRAETTKTSVQRTIPLRSHVVDELVRLRRIHHEFYGRLPTSAQTIFLAPAGDTWIQSTVNSTREFDRLLALAGIPKKDARGHRVTIHSLRHTCSSRLARAGVGIVQLQKILGHKDPKMTTEVYTHLAAEDLRSAVNQLPEVDFDGLPGTKVAHAPKSASDDEPRD